MRINAALKKINIQNNIQNTPKFSFKEVVNKLETSWTNMEFRSQKILNGLPNQVKPLVQAQFIINDLSLKSQMITRAGEAVASTMRRIQQFGS